MKYRCLSVVLTAAVLLFSSGLSSAIENKTDTSQAAATKADASPKKTKNEIGTKHKKHPAKIILVDINSATKEELKKLPGIGDAEADKIIAGRPFGSKAWLGTNNVIPMATYQAVKELIICNITKKDFDRITAQAAHKNKKQ